MQPAVDPAATPVAMAVATPMPMQPVAMAVAVPMQPAAQVQGMHDPDFVALMSSTGTWCTAKPVTVGIASVEIEVTKTTPTTGTMRTKVTICGCCLMANQSHTIEYSPDFGTSVTQGSHGIIHQNVLESVDLSTKRAVYTTSVQMPGRPPQTGRTTLDARAGTITMTSNHTPQVFILEKVEQGVVC